jgi:KUP system potassium uptake protein
MADALREDAIDLHRPSWRRSSSARPRAWPGTAVFLTAEPGTVPNALLHNLKHNKVLHEQNLFVTVRTTSALDRLRQALRDRGAGPRLLAGDAALRLQERPRRARGAAAAARPRHRARRDGHQLLPQPRQVIPTLRGGMALWREKLFAGMHRNASAAADFLSLPTNRVVELGSKVEI